MKTMLSAAVAAMAIMSAGAANAATVLYQGSGTGLILDQYYLALPGSGRYKVEMTTSRVSYLQADSTYDHNWDVFYAPAPKPEQESIEGNEWDVWQNHTAKATSLKWVFNIPALTRDFFPSDQFYKDIYGIPLGTPLYEETRPEYMFVTLWADAVDEQVIDYTYSVTLLDGSVPEPATWAMMIIGFGATGSLLRRQRKTALPA